MRKEAKVGELDDIRKGKRGLTIKKAVAFLRDFGADDDPIMYDNVNTTPTVLAKLLPWDNCAKKTRIGYHVSGGFINGTLAGMVYDRRSDV